MKISIITATYNSEKHIQGVIASIASQTYKNIEWVVVDGASKDATVNVIKENYTGELNILSEPDKGIYDALNKGLTLATGDIIGFLHSDDFFENETVIERIATQFQLNNCDGVYGDLRYVNVEDTAKIVRYWKSNPFHSSLLKKGWMPAHPALFLKKEVYQKHGNFDTSFKIAADYDFMLRILKDEILKFHYLPEVITNMRVGGASNTLGNIKQKMKEDLTALKKNGVGGVSTLARKNISKITQFFLKK
jgi:glycosyltransferase involved in cell wall biosynthesis